MTGPAHNVASVADFLHRALVAGAIDVTQLEAMARAAGLLGKRQQIQHAKAFKKAKRSLGIRSIREGFGSTGKWAWLLPPKPVKPANKEADRTRDATTREQAHSVIVNLNGLPADLLAAASLLIEFVKSLASKAIEYQRKFLRIGGVNSSTTATHSSWLRKTGLSAPLSMVGMIWNCSAAAAVRLSALGTPNPLGDQWWQACRITSRLGSYRTCIGPISARSPP